MDQTTTAADWQAWPALPASLLLVIDMQRVIMPGYPWEIPGIEPVIGRIAALASSFPGRAIATRHRIDPNGPGTWQRWARRWAPELGAHADSEQLVPELGHLPTIDKTTYSAASAPEVERASLQADGVILCGVETDCCVAATMFDLVDAGVPVILVTDAVLGPNAAAHTGVLSGLDRFEDQIRPATTAELLERCP